MREKVAYVCLVMGLMSVFMSCVSQPKPMDRQQYPSGIEFYPAVYGAVKQYLPASKNLDIDFYNNIYKITNIYLRDLLLLKRFDLVIRLFPDGIDITYENMYMYSEDRRNWQATSGFMTYNFNKLVSDMVAKMLETANNPSLYEENEKAAMADIYFVYAIVKNMTAMAFNDFIEKYAKGSIFNIEGAISDVEEANKEIDGKLYRYVVSVTMELTDDNLSFDLFNDDKIYCYLYTNNSSVIRLTKASVYTVRALLAGARKSEVGTNMFIDLVDADT